jgi:site-specific DNA-methyltransferase (adenine-specific)
VLARKPLVGTVAANVLAHGTGGINVDGCRIGTDEARYFVTNNEKSDASGPIHFLGHSAVKRGGGNAIGRWPANVLLDAEAAALLDEQSGVRQSGVRQSGVRKGMGFHGASGDGGPAIEGSSGGASRFFYVAKAARAERDAGLAHLPPRTGGEATDRKDGSDGLNSPRAGAGRRGGARNTHPTVKPIELMRYLVRLVTPPGGLVLDPFAGSGTTGIAALREGARFVGVDLEPEYARLAIARIEEDAPLFNRRRGE